MTNSERMISRQRAFLPAPGEARADWRAIAGVAARLGHGARFAWTGPAAIFREHAALSGFGNDGARLFDISALAGLDDPAYQSLTPTRWPCPAAGPTPARLLGAGRFPTPDGRPRAVATPFRPPAASADAAFPFTLLTGRLRDQWHIMTRTGAIPRLMAHAPEPELAAHPADTALPPGCLVRITTPHGHAVLRLRHDPGLRRGTLFAPMHWTAAFAPAARINAAVTAAADPISGQPELKATPAALAAAPADWHGFVLLRQRLPADLAPWCAVVPEPGDVWRHELAGGGDAAPALASLVDATGLTGAWLRLDDIALGTHRAVLVRQGRLDACIFVAAAVALPPRGWLVKAKALPSRRKRAARDPPRAGGPWIPLYFNRIRSRDLVPGGSGQSPVLLETDASAIMMHSIGLENAMTAQARIDAVFAALGIEVGFSATHLPSGQTVAINSHALFPTASVYKIAVMVEVYRQADEGKFRLTDRLPLTDAQRIIGSGVLQKLDNALAPTIRDLAMLMIIISDNTATHMLQELVGSASINATMHRLGLRDIHVALSLPQSFAHGFGMKLDPPPDYPTMQRISNTHAMDYRALTFQASDRNTTSSAADMAALAAMILQGSAGSAAACVDMMTILRAQQLRDRVPRYLPTGSVGNKTGTFRGVRNDAGVILRSDSDAIAFGLFTFDRTELPMGNSRLLAHRNALVNDAMAEVGAILWEALGV